MNPGPVLGDPPTVVAPFDVTHFDSLFTALVAEANHTILSRITGGVGPSLNADLTCNTSDPLNWGAPEDPTHACFDYFPIIYADLGMNITENTSGRGIFLTDTDTQANAGFHFYGLIMSHGTETNNDSEMWGAVYSNNVSFNNEIENGSKMLYSSCVMQRVAQGTGLVWMARLPGFSAALFFRPSGSLARSGSPPGDLAFAPLSKRSTDAARIRFPASVVPLRNIGREFLRSLQTRPARSGDSAAARGRRR